MLASSDPCSLLLVLYNYIGRFQQLLLLEGNMRMAFVLLFSITAMVFSSLFLGSEGNIDVMIEVEEYRSSTKMLYRDLLEELNGAHLRIAASHV